MRLRYSQRNYEGWDTRFAWLPKWVGDPEEHPYYTTYSNDSGHWIWLEKYLAYRYPSGSLSSSQRRLLPDKIYDPNQ